MFITIILLLAIVGSLALGLVVYLNSSRQAANRIFFLLAISVALWTGFNLLTNLSPNNTYATIFARLTLIPALMIAYSIWLLSYYFPVHRKFPKIINYLILSAIVVSAPLTLTAYNVIESTPDGSTFSTGIVYLTSTAIFIILLGYGLINYIRILRSSRGNDRQRIALIVLGFFVSGLLGFIIAVILPLLGFNGLLQAVPVVTLIMLTSFAYAIVRHQLFDIRAVVARSVTYILTIGIIAFLYGFIAFRFANIFIDNLNPQLQQTFYVVLTVILAFTFAPLRRFFERISNRIFYRDRYDSQELINEVGRILASEIELDKVSNRVLHEITRQIKIDKGEIVVFGENQLFYENNVFKNGNGKISSDELSKLGRVMVVSDDLQSGNRKDLLQKYGINISLALRTSEKFIGYMLLGQKKSGDIYNDQDLRVLKTLANEVSIAMANALSYKEIQLFSETLSEKVRQRTAQLRTANDQLKELDKAKDEFISMASHQLRTPLTTVKGYASMLQEGDFGHLSKEQKDTIDLTLDGANRMARLIDDLLNVSRMDANRFFLEANQVDLNKLVVEELEQLKTFAEGKNVELTYEPPKHKIPIIQIDENKTRQVVMNLVDNALHYSAPPGGGGHVKVSMEQSGDFVEFKVVDDGIGVPETVQKKLFTKMFRAPNAQTVRPDGTGLGLYLVKRVVEQQGGEIWFESKEGKGSTFGFKLPLSGIPKETLEESKKIGAKVAASHAKAGA